MAKHGRHRRPGGGRVTPKGTRPPESRHHGGRRVPGPDAFLDGIARHLREPDPTGLLHMASSIVEMATERPSDRFSDDPPTRVDLGALLESFVDSGLPETQALAWAMVPMLDPPLAQRVLAGMAPPSSGPRWLARLHDAHVTGVRELSDVLGDGDNLMIGVEWPGGTTATAVVYVDHNVGSLVKDAFVIPEDVTSMERQYLMLIEQQGRLGDQTIGPIDPADARARIEHAIRIAEITVPPFTGETWPSCRPLVEWWLGLLPPGGTGEPDEPPGPEERERQVDAFLRSPHAAALGLPDDVVRAAVDSLFWYAGGRGRGDLLQWSPVMVELVLVDFYPRKVLAPYSERRHVPDILRTLVRYAHAERGIRPERTAEVEEAIDRWTPEFLEAIGRPAPSPTERARQAAEIALRGMREPTMAELMADLEVHMVDTLGGPQRSAALDDAPLPDRPFDWSGTTPEQEPFLHETLRHIDRVCEELFDAEVRTIARAVLACVNEGDSQLWTRSPRPDAVAGAVVWLAERTGGAATIPDGPWDPPTQKRIAEVLGIRPALISDRIGRFERLIDPQRVPQPEMWHSARRRHALQALRDVRQWRAEHTDG